MVGPCAVCLSNTQRRAWKFVIKVFELAKVLSNMTVFGAALLAMFLTACGADPTVTASPTTTPTPRLITVNPEEDPAEFLRALPGSEQECLEQAVDPEQLEEFIANLDPENEIWRACLGEKTVRAVTLGQLAREAGGLSDESVKCLLEETGSVDFRSMIFGDEIGPRLGSLITQAAALCFSDEELLRGFDFFDQNLNAEQLRCFFTSNLGDVATFGQPSPEVTELLNECDLPSGLFGELAVPPPLSTEVETCLIDAIGEEALQEVFSGQRSPTSEEIEAFAGCNVGGSDIVPGSPQMEFPDFETLPEIAAPMELGTVVWPNNVEDALSLLERLPDEISGHGLTGRQGGLGDDRPEISYFFGEDPETQEPALEARVHYLSHGDFFPADTTAGDFVALFAQGFDWEVLAAGREGSLGWVQIKTTFGTSQGVEGDIYGMLWGNDSSSLAFGVQAIGPEELADVVRAMVSAAR